MKKRRSFLGALIVGGTIVLIGSESRATDYQVFNGTPDARPGDGACGLTEALQAAGSRIPVDACPAGQTDNSITIYGDPAAAINLTLSGYVDIGTGISLYADPGSGFFQTIVGNSELIRIQPGGNLYITNLRFTGFAVTPFTVSSKYVSGKGLVRGSLFFEDAEIAYNNQGSTANSQTKGILNIGGHVELLNTTIHDNTMGNIKGAAVFNQGGGELYVTSSSLYGNHASQYGGAIYNYGAGSYAYLYASTLSGNSADGGGGGLYNGSGATADVIWTTITANRSMAYNSSPTANGPGIHTDSGSKVRIKRSIVSGNIATVGSATDCYGSLTSQGFNLLEKCPGTVATYGDITGVSANLGPLTHPSPSQNFWFAPWHTPNASSRAINAIPSGTDECGPDLGITDQIYNPRLAGSGCDMGAIEVQ